MLGASAASSVLSIVAGVWWPDPATRPLSLRRPISGFSTQCLIRPVGRKFIMDHYRAYGGPKPPPIDHQGIESAGESADYRHALEPPLTKSARPVGDTEKVAQEWLRGASGFERRGYCRTRERPFPRNIGHFPQVRAGVPLTRSAESSLPDRMAPQVGFEPTTLRLTAEPSAAASRCKQHRPTHLIAPSRRWRPWARTRANSGEPTAHRMVWSLLGVFGGASRVTARHSTKPVTL